MKPIIVALSILATSFVTSPVWAAETIPLARFDGVGLDGSGMVNIRHGAAQQVVLREGSSTVSQIEVDRWGGLEIRTCRYRDCPRGYRLVVDVVTPQVDDLAVNGSGQIRVGPGFAAVAKRDLAVSGSGQIDARSLPATEIEAAVSGSGLISLGAARRLQAAISGSGHIDYAGNPAVQQAISGSGSIGPGR